MEDFNIGTNLIIAIAQYDVSLSTKFGVHFGLYFKTI